MESYPSRGSLIQKVKVTLQHEQWRGHFIYPIRGSIRGLDVLEWVFGPGGLQDGINEGLIENHCNLSWNEDNELYHFELKHDDQVRQFDVEAYYDDFWNFVVGLEITQAVVYDERVD